MLPVLRAYTTQACTSSSMLRAGAVRCSTRPNAVPAGACWLSTSSSSRPSCSVQCRHAGSSRSSSTCSSCSSESATTSSRPQHMWQELGALRNNGPSSRHLSTQPPRSAKRGVSCQSASDDAASTSTKPNSVLTLPTILTLARVAAIPVLIAGFFWTSPQAPAACTALFVGASLTDWLDGYLARKMNTSSAFGAFLDPVADKLMVAAVLILLCTQPLAAGPWAGNTWIMPVLTLVIIGREITMSALREWAAIIGPAASAAVAVNSWGKWKTATQMVSLTLLLLTRDGASGPILEAAATAAIPLLSIAAYLSVHSLAIYLKSLWRFMV